MTNRAFVLKISKTDGLSIAELARSLSRLAGQLDSGRVRVEGGIVRGAAGQAIGSYHWEDQKPKPE